MLGWVFWELAPSGGGENKIYVSSKASDFSLLISAPIELSLLKI